MFSGGMEWRTASAPNNNNQQGHWMKEMGTVLVVVVVVQRGDVSYLQELGGKG